MLEKIEGVIVKRASNQETLATLENKTQDEVNEKKQKQRKNEIYKKKNLLLRTYG